MIDTPMVKTKEYPILYKGDMVRAILAGQKTETRRVTGKALKKINENPDAWELLRDYQHDLGPLYALFRSTETGETLAVRSPYGVKGDRLWVRETWNADFFYQGGYVWAHNMPRHVRVGSLCISIAFAADGKHYLFDHDYYEERGQNRWDRYGESRRLDDLDNYNSKPTRWMPSIFMPRWASRLTLVNEGVSYERLSDITTESIIAEGLSTKLRGHAACVDLKEQWNALWDKINGDTYPAELNPWVRVVKLSVMEDV